MNNKLARQGLLWSTIERLGTQAIQLLLMLYLGRVLGPSSFGYVGMLTLFLSLAQVLIDSGFSAALIRKSERTEKDYSTVFIFNICLSILIYIVLYCLSSYIALFYQIPLLESLLDILALTVIANGLTLIPKIQLTVDVNFKIQAKSSLIAITSSSVIAITLAAMGYGVWTLVFQSLSYSVINCIVLNIYNPWYPKEKFCYETFKKLFSFSSNLLIAGVLEAFYSNIYQLIIGKFFTPQLVGQFTQANQISSVPAMTLTNIIQRVTYPLFCNIYNGKGKIDDAYLNTLKIAGVVVFPILLGIGLISKPLVSVLLGSEWKFTSDILFLLCIAFMIYPIHAININILQVHGRSDLFLRLEILKKTLMTIILVITMQININAMVIGLVLHSYLSWFLNGLFSQKVSTITIRKQLKELLPIWCLCLISGLGSNYIINEISMEPLLNIIFTILLNAIIYITLIRIMYKEIFMTIISLIKK